MSPVRAALALRGERPKTRFHFGRLMSKPKNQGDASHISFEDIKECDAFSDNELRFLGEVGSRTRAEPWL